MSTHHLKHLFTPKSVALIGASTNPSSIGAVITKNLLSAGFNGPIMLVNPKHKMIEGIESYPNVSLLPTTPELAIIATPPRTIIKLLKQLGEKGTKAAVIISAGFAETGDEKDKKLQQELIDTAKKYDIRIVGPNCIGILNPHIGLNASFSHINSQKGKLAIVSQSGSLMTSVLDWATSHDIGFSHLVSLGSMSDVDFGDMLDYLANDRHTRAILLYVEEITEARKFMSAARSCARIKPVLVCKVGRYAAGAEAAASHTGALAGEDNVYDAAFRRAGMLRIFSLEEVFDAIETLSVATPTKGDRLAVLTNGGGLGVLTADELVSHNGKLGTLSPETIDNLNKVLPPTWSHSNPIDIIGDATGERYADALKILNQDKNIDAILVLNCPTAIASSTDAARAVVENMPKPRDKLLFASWVGERAAEKARDIFIEHNVPVYDTPEQAVRAFMYLVKYRRRQTILMQTPQSIPKNLTLQTAEAKQIIRTALDNKKQWLNEAESKVLLQTYSINVGTTKVIQTPEEAGLAAEEFACPVAIKILSPDILHKSDAGGVILDLTTPIAAQKATKSMLARIHSRYPDARIEGVSIEPMVKVKDAYKLIIGMTEDPVFGPVLVFGHGGTAVEVINDKAIGLPPLNMRLARDMISRTRIYQLLKGYRGFPAANCDEAALTLIKVSQLIIDNPEIIELDINPLLLDDTNAIALDARIKLEERVGVSTKRIAIRPYPKELEEIIELNNGRQLFLRPIRPEDEPELHKCFSKLSPEEIRLRFFASLKSLSHFTAARFTQIDYDREMALTLTDIGISGKTTIYGVVRIIADADNDTAEFAIIILKEKTGKGLGLLMMQRIIAHAKRRGIRKIVGDVLVENNAMLKLCKTLGFTKKADPDDHSIAKVSLLLSDDPGEE
ncbi:MAG: GNAT family N-acetyltransferase [uncultured Thiotrichaceae bacterium]|uniref:GNAT family N-acetyltransferase n=1 Tax=uncultured Thiotrichaceae bacterium TaxID=298394 RepID=A0A6S6TQE9_9GAMM|nr:MAG: GNAT family N-acetyltransferase [uncultured Thiotrichaceae bacterium]